MDEETPKPSADEHKEEYRSHRRSRAEGETDDATLGEIEEEESPRDEPSERRKRMHRPEQEVPREDDPERTPGDEPEERPED